MTHAPTSPPAEPGEKIPGYEIQEVVGRGGMGTVYKAVHLRTERIVALKVLKKDLAETPAFVERFLRETKMAARISHPNIVMAYDAGQVGRLYYYAMEFVDGESLHELLARRGRLPEAEALGIFRQMLNALSVIHARGMIHRDIKPENILLTREGTAKLCDLGLARPENRDAPGLTQPGMAMGTPAFISPEQIEGRTDLDIRADLYALGGTLYSMLTGQPPYPGSRPMDIVAKHLKAPIPDPRRIVPSISRPTAEIIRRCLQKDRNRRYSSPREILEELDRGPIEERPEQAPNQEGRGVRRMTQRMHPAPALTERIVRRRMPRSKKTSMAVPLVLGLILVGVVVYWSRAGGFVGSKTGPPERPKKLSPESVRSSQEEATARVLLREVNAHLDAGRWAQALELIRKVLGRYGNTRTVQEASARLREKEALCMKVLSERTAALAKLEKAAREAEASGNWKSAAEAYGRILKLKGMTEELRTKYERRRQEAADRARRALIQAKLPAVLEAGLWEDALRLAENLPDDWRGENGETREVLVRRLREELAAEGLLLRAQTHRDDKAWDLLERALKELREQYGETRTVRGSNDLLAELQRSLDRARVEQQTEAARNLLGQADRAYQEQRWHTAREAYRRCLAAFPTADAIVKRRAEIEKRIAECSRRLAQSAETAARYTLASATVHMDAGEWKEALRLLRRLVKEYRTTLFVRRNLEEILDRIDRCLGHLEGGR